jgi:hypothetical protein
MRPIDIKPTRRYRILDLLESVIVIGDTLQTYKNIKLKQPKDPYVIKAIIHRDHKQTYINLKEMFYQLFQLEYQKEKLN